MGYTGQEVVVAVLDDGCYYNHPDLNDHLWDGSSYYYDANGDSIENPGERLYYHGWDFQDNDNDPIDDGVHGTPVAGIVAGDGTGTGTEQKQTGVAPDATLIFIRCISSSDSSTEGNMQKGFQFFLDMKEQYGDAFQMPDVITMSLSVKFRDKPDYTEWRNYSTLMFQLGIVHTNSIGNQGNYLEGGCIGSDPWGCPIPYNIAAPGNCPPPWPHPDQTDPLNTNASHFGSTNAVGAVDSNDVIWEGSGRGPAAWEDIQYLYAPCQYSIPDSLWDYRYDTVPVNDRNALIKPDVTAPSGDGMYSTACYGGYTTFGGTSAATPHVAGAAALMLSAEPDLTPAMVSQILQETAVELGPAGKDSLYGSGRIDAYEAVTSMKSGTLAHDETWSNWALVIGDVTVPHGVTLTIEPGTRVEFAPTDNQSSGDDPTRCELIVCGDLIADGTSSDGIIFTSSASSPTKADWYGIVLGDSSSTLDHCTMSYADKGLHCYKCSLEINNFDISECNYGAYVETTGTKLYLDSTSISDCSKGIHVNKGALRLTDCQLNDNSVGLECHYFRAFYKAVPPFYTRSYPDFKDCEFNDNTQEGILLYDSSPRINYCDISDNGLWGMKCDDDSDPTLGYVTLTGNGCPGKEEDPPASGLTHGGLHTTGTSCPVVCDGIVSGSYDRGYNTITGNCSTGVSAHSNSAPKLGKGLVNKGENSIYNNTVWEIYNGTGATIYAEYNWWNDVTGPNWDKVYGSVDPYPWLVEPPSKSGKRGITHLATRSSVGEPSTPGEYNELGTIHLLQLEYDQAIEAFEYVLANFPDTPEANYALVHLMHCYRNGGYIADIDPYLNSVILNSQNEELKDLANYMTVSQLCRAGQYESALSTIATLLAADCDEEMQRSMKFRKGMIYRYDLDNKSAAIETFEEFITHYPDDHRTPLAQLELDILGVDQTRRIGPQEKIAVMDASLPGDYALYPNYPNPFNAQTCIEYEIPEAVEVSLSVYNVLGQRVIVLEDDLRPAGRYRAIWDGLDNHGQEVASGIYFARLQAGEFTFTKKMVLIR